MSVGEWEFVSWGKKGANEPVQSHTGICENHARLDAIWAATVAHSRDRMNPEADVVIPLVVDARVLPFIRRV